MYALSAVYAEHDVVHLAIYVAYVLVGECDCVGGDRKAEFLPRGLFHAPGVIHRGFHGFHVQQRFAAEKVHFQPFTRSAFFDKEINGFTRHFGRHQIDVAVILTVPRETIAASEIATVHYVEAERLHHALVHGFGMLGLGSEEHTRFYELVYLAFSFRYLRFAVTRKISFCVRKRRYTFLY